MFIRDDNKDPGSCDSRGTLTCTPKDLVTTFGTPTADKFVFVDDETNEVFVVASKDAVAWDNKNEEDFDVVGQTMAIDFFFWISEELPRCTFEGGYE